MSLERIITDTIIARLSGASPRVISQEELTLGQIYPVVTIFAAGGKEVEQGCGVYRVRVLVEVLSELDVVGSRDDHAAMVDTIRELIEQEEATVAALSSGIMKCYAIRDFTLDSGTRDRIAVSSIAFDVIAGIQ